MAYQQQRFRVVGHNHSDNMYVNIWIFIIKWTLNISLKFNHLTHIAQIIFFLKWIQSFPYFFALILDCVDRCWLTMRISIKIIYKIVSSILNARKTKTNCELTMLLLHERMWSCHYSIEFPWINLFEWSFFFLFHSIQFFYILNCSDCNLHSSAVLHSSRECHDFNLVSKRVFIATFLSKRCLRYIQMGTSRVRRHVMIKRVWIWFALIWIYIYLNHGHKWN